MARKFTQAPILKGQGCTLVSDSNPFWLVIFEEKEVFIIAGLWLSKVCWLVDRADGKLAGLIILVNKRMCPAFNSKPSRKMWRPIKVVSNCRKQAWEQKPLVGSQSNGGSSHFYIYIAWTVVANLQYVLYLSILG